VEATEQEADEKALKNTLTKAGDKGPRADWGLAAHFG
jgi:hypothetical protein